ncbi:hypothetical protein PLESTB_000495500 [Pleodorina starrii]|uniref:Uncharacterized protein n=1 Tax=Pleodorina starrii TaxID=330485 RepID=A0A9W6F0I9_9CHLO|nr:hypothetical protein PLESTM_000366900 [Pleodorina starrii]GLC51375.1 hypothetical protein PLESTB_000495500 [Pleodorina starrii]GLC63740.1 hypothetical protein PLESTF_000069000 [Pleodorina starrii]
MEGKAQRREKLDCPAVPPLEQKLANLTRQRPAIGPTPRSSVLDKLAAFMPQMANANASLQQQLQERPAAEFDIEQVDDEEDGPYIEMDLACGILELRDEAALRAAERALEGQGDPFLNSGSDSSSSDDDDSDEDGADDDEDDAESDNEGCDSEGECRGGEVGTAQGPQPMEEDEAVAAGSGDVASAQAAGSGRQGRAGRGRAAQALGGGELPGRRRKIAAQRNKMIEEL